MNRWYNQYDCKFARNAPFNSDPQICVSACHPDAKYELIFKLYYYSEIKYQIPMNKVRDSDDKPSSNRKLVDEPQIRAS